MERATLVPQSISGSFPTPHGTNATEAGAARRGAALRELVLIPPGGWSDETCSYVHGGILRPLRQARGRTLSKNRSVLNTQVCALSALAAADGTLFTKLRRAFDDGDATKVLILVEKAIEFAARFDAQPRKQFRKLLLVEPKKTGDAHSSHERAARIFDALVTITAAEEQLLAAIRLALANAMEEATRSLDSRHLGHPKAPDLAWVPLPKAPIAGSAGRAVGVPLPSELKEQKDVLSSIQRHALRLGTAFSALDPRCRQSILGLWRQACPYRGAPFVLELDRHSRPSAPLAQALSELSKAAIDLQASLGRKNRLPTADLPKEKRLLKSIATRALSLTVALRLLHFSHLECVFAKARKRVTRRGLFNKHLSSSLRELAAAAQNHATTLLGRPGMPKHSTRDTFISEVRAAFEAYTGSRAPEIREWEEPDTSVTSGHLTNPPMSPMDCWAGFLHTVIPEWLHPAGRGLERATRRRGRRRAD